MLTTMETPRNYVLGLIFDPMYRQVWINGDKNPITGFETGIIAAILDGVSAYATLAEKVTGNVDPSVLAFWNYLGVIKNREECVSYHVYYTYTPSRAKLPNNERSFWLSLPLAPTIGEITFDQNFIVAASLAQFSHNMRNHEAGTPVINLELV